MKSSLLITFVFVLATLTCSSQTKYSKIKIDLSKVDIQEVTKLGLETDHGFLKKGLHFVNDFSEDELRILDNAGIEYFILEDDVIKAYKEAKKLSSSRGGSICEANSNVYNYPTPSNYTFGSMGGYHTYSELLNVLDLMREKYPNLISAKAPIGDIKTWEDNEIFWLRVSDNPDVDEDEPEVLYTALHHAREPNGLSQMIFYLWYILENYESDEEVKYLVDNTEMYFVPCINPDGYIYNQTIEPDGGGLWRKNRRPSEIDGEVGVDLNRNYGFEWGIDDGGSSPNPGSQTYRGPEPFSEPETQAIRDFSIDHKFEVALNYHTFGNLLIHPWGFNDQPTEEDSLFKAIGRAMIKENDFTLGTGTETVGYVVNGDSDDYLYGEEGEKDKIYAMTPEVGTTFWPQQTQIDGLNKSCMRQNFAAAHAVLNFYDTRMENIPTVHETLAGTIELSVTKAGLRDGAGTIELISNSSFLSFDQFLYPVDLRPGQSELLDVIFSLSQDIPSEQELSFDVKTDNGEFSYVETYTFIYKDLIRETIFEDNLESLTSWSTEGSWALTGADFVSSPTSLTDSPSGNYQPGVTNVITLLEEIDLVGVTGAALTFSAKWDIEANYDYVLVQATSDGSNWTSLCGNYTRNGINTHGTNDPLFDRVQLEWVQEEMDLSDFSGQIINIRLVMFSDGGVEADGFYIDDIRIESQKIVTSTDDPLSNIISVYPTASRGQFTIELTDAIDKNASSLEILDMTGTTIKTLQSLGKIVSVDISGVPSGIYVVKLKDGDRVFTKKVSILK